MFQQSYNRKHNKLYKKPVKSVHSKHLLQYEEYLVLIYFVVSIVERIQ